MPKDWPPFTPDDGITTHTTREQRTTENKVLHVLQSHGYHGYPQEDTDRYCIYTSCFHLAYIFFRIELFREKHISFLMKAFDSLSQGYLISTILLKFASETSTVISFQNSLIH
jgi:hypothetical protein